MYAQKSYTKIEPLVKVVVSVDKEDAEPEIHGWGVFQLKYSKFYCFVSGN